LYDS